MKRAIIATTAALLCATLPGAAPRAASDAGLDWLARKCRLYADAWAHVRESLGPDDLGAGFVSSNDAFIAQGCRKRVAVCPRSRLELQVADVLTLAMANAGATGSFLPFSCASD
ncbi:hypothetical protein SAMN06265365_13228 [Tistlia consotensis]|uniref:HdeA/HdeB family protein n=1 Tax=Tistlia consotensis USBA 355 TaxID=560819 RepID=A0A1Y6CM64_9PROT|nr:hypothetical protein [Tistlia consotensis]SMF76203.1 hypothetical protein SAMN05428998_13528 [Tistlia consotensis USBA 355]SNS12458.1 hypothetical protein SAMN06265365_13228 [Tistlia consotensis]